MSVFRPNAAFVPSELSRPGLPLSIATSVSTHDVQYAMMYSVGVVNPKIWKNMNRNRRSQPPAALPTSILVGPPVDHVRIPGAFEKLETTVVAVAPPPPPPASHGEEEGMFHRRFKTPKRFEHECPRHACTNTHVHHDLHLTSRSVSSHINCSFYSS